MAKRNKSDGGARQGPPVSFRPGAEIEGLLSSFAARRAVSLNEACKHLSALAVVGLDGRYYMLVVRMAEATGGPGAFGRACAHVHTTLAAVARSGGRRSEDERVRLVAEAAQDYLAARGQTLRLDDLVALLSDEGVFTPTPAQPAAPDLAGTPAAEPTPAASPAGQAEATRVADPAKKRRTLRRVDD